MKRIQLTLLFMVVFFVAFLLGSTPAGKAAPPLAITSIVLDGVIVVTFEGGVLTGACVLQNPDDPDSECIEMIEATRAWVTNGPPEFSSPIPINGRELNYTTLGAATGSYLVWDGRRYRLCYFPGCNPF
ncbi:MAG: hypothetical protein GTN81_04340 [Proteobacteria bacterium]|nr:hypothetical protein [Pseudomonadota bacterium]